MKIKKLILLFAVFILITTSFSFASTDIETDSEASLLVEVSTGKILYEKNAYKKMYPASTTKILTAILVLENCELDDVATVSGTALSNIPEGYVTCNLLIGEKMSIKDLLYALMVPSANDAAFVLAEHVGGSVEGFADMMNEKAEEIGCTGSHFVNPNGIHDEDHYTTAYDLYLIANYAMKNETFRDIVSTTKYTLPATNLYDSNDRILTTSNELLKKNSTNYYYEYAIGIKTGHTTEAGNCLVAESSKDGLEFISVVLNGGTTSSGLNARYIDTINLFDYGYDNYTFSDVITENSVVTSIEVENGTKDTKNLDLIADNTINALHNKELDLNTITPEISLNEDISAPITAGEKIGTATYTIEDEQYTVNLLANSNVERDISIYIAILIIGILLLIVAITIMKKSRRNR